MSLSEVESVFQEMLHAHAKMYVLTLSEPRMIALNKRYQDLVPVEICDQLIQADLVAHAKLLLSRAIIQVRPILSFGEADLMAKACMPLYGRQHYWSRFTSKPARTLEFRCRRYNSSNLRGLPLLTDEQLEKELQALSVLPVSLEVESEEG